MPVLRADIDHCPRWMSLPLSAIESRSERNWLRRFRPGGIQMRRIQIPVAVLCVFATVHSLAQEGGSFTNSNVFETSAFPSGVPNTGACNTGACNTGACNTGACNTGACNTGGWHTDAGFYGGYGHGSGQLYPFDQQDPWLHGQHKRVPSYGGYSSFRPYNYRHVASQSQIAASLGVAAGMTYSQQFWNRYREGYMNQKLHSHDYENGGFAPAGNAAYVPQRPPYSAVGFPQAQPLVRLPALTTQTSSPHYNSAAPTQLEPSVHVYPSGALNR